MSGGEVRHLSGQNLQVVQNLILRCIQLHMSKIEAVSVLSRDANILPGITELVWQRLEEENREFFQFYYIQLALKEQIRRFNDLLKKQAALVEQIPAGVANEGVSNGSCMAQFQQNAGCYPIDQTRSSMRAENLQPAMAPSLPLPFTNGVSPMQTPSAYDMSTQSRRTDFLPETLHVQRCNSMRSMQGLNGGMIKSESSYPSDSQIIFDSDPNVGYTHGHVEDASVANFSGMEGCSQPLNETLLGMNGSCSTFGQLGQIPKTFSFPDLSAYPHVLDNYPSSDFITTDTNNFLDSRDRGEIQEDNKGAISGGYNTYDDFGSD